MVPSQMMPARFLRTSAWKADAACELLEDRLEDQKAEVSDGKIPRDAGVQQPASYRLWALRVAVVACLAAAVTWTWRAGGAARSEFLIEGILPTEKDFVMHLGGYCFRGDQFAAQVMGHITMELQGVDGFVAKSFHDAFPVNSLRIAVFNDQPGEWSSVREGLNLQQLPTLVSHASLCFDMGSVWGHELPMETATVKIAEKFKRKWNVVLMGRNVSYADPKKPVHYRLSAVGATATWSGPEEGPPSGSCPIEPIEFLRQQINDAFGPAPDQAGGTKAPLYLGMSDQLLPGCY
eukprot:TRINITY_DN27819_c0_g1_i1.p1 TRINITY_DN27819_c0_g1~~TRINITY_DN27819_c0_g1_i1.p1  ORF type:complete len:292 (+),score=51.75 TRINITY_DN27819_c0_g1_i1:112-987(+)